MSFIESHLIWEAVKKVFVKVLSKGSIVGTLSFAPDKFTHLMGITRTYSLLYLASSRLT
jgi:hypothetical protein